MPFTLVGPCSHLFTVSNGDVLFVILDSRIQSIHVASSHLRSWIKSKRKHSNMHSSLNSFRFFFRESFFRSLFFFTSLLVSSLLSRSRVFLIQSFILYLFYLNYCCFAFIVPSNWDLVSVCFCVASTRWISSNEFSRKHYTILFWLRLAQRTIAPTKISMKCVNTRGSKHRKYLARSRSAWDRWSTVWHSRSLHIRDGWCALASGIYLFMLFWLFYFNYITSYARPHWRTHNKNYTDRRCQFHVCVAKREREKREKREIERDEEIEGNKGKMRRIMKYWDWIMVTCVGL